ncbi:MAG: TonB-dependent receptor domain-containing protein [Longimicrobiales bacterium]
MRRLRGAVRLWAVIGLVSGSFAGETLAQSVTKAGLSVRVESAQGEELAGGRVEARELDSGLRYEASARGGGTYSLDALPPGRYEIFVERLGYRPALLRVVGARAGGVTHALVRLAPTEPPVTGVDTVIFAATSAAIVPGPGTWVGRRLIEGLPWPRRTAAALRLPSTIAGDGAIQGLPARSSTTVVDGQTFPAVRHPWAAADPLGRTGPFNLLALGGAGVYVDPVDVEYGRGATGFLTLFTAPAEAGAGVAFVSGAAGGMISELGAPAGAPNGSWVDAGARITGQMLGDSARLAVAVEGGRYETVFVPAAAELVAPFTQVAADSFGISLDETFSPRLIEAQRISAFGRLDWVVSSSSELSVGFGAAVAPEASFRLPGRHAQEALATTDGNDLFGTIALTSRIRERWTSELRIAGSRSTRSFTDGGTEGAPRTLLAGADVAIGIPAEIPGRFGSTGAQLRETVHYNADRHRLKGGVELGLRHLENEFSGSTAAGYVFGDAAAFAGLAGLLELPSVAWPSASFSITSLGAFVQDTWSAAPGLDLTLGFRYDQDRLPHDEIGHDAEWFRLSGMAADSAPAEIAALSPRVGFTWSAGGQSGWVVHGSAGRYADPFDPAALVEAVVLSAPGGVQREVGTLSAWSERPAVSGPVTERHALLAPEFRSPQSARASLGLVRSIGASTAIRLVGAYRETDFLPRRVDLNLQSSPAALDQHGRILYGEPLKLGAMLAATVGSNRRFPDYDVVWALNADGSSTYRGITIGAEHEGPLSVGIEYTYSETTDDWVDAGLSPGPQSPPLIAQGLDDWDSGVSDFDVRHRAAATALLSFPTSVGDLGVAGLYTYRSGLPFTPIVAAGVDANLDGIAGNEPAFVDAQVDGIQELSGQWDCLRLSSGAFVERNACRTPAAHALHLRGSVGLRGTSLRGELFVELINALASVSDGPVNPSLYRIDPTAALAEADGELQIPLITNPAFGEPLLGQGEPRILRIGTRILFR